MVARTRRFGTKVRSRPLRGASVQDKLKRAKEKASRKYLSKPHPFPQVSRHLVSAHPMHNVVGVGIGHKCVDGKETKTLCVRLYVRNKLRTKHVLKKHALPDEIDGIPTDVIEVGTPRLVGTTGPTDRMRPARPGCSIAVAPLTPVSGSFIGTFGALVEDADGKVYILSNNHVLSFEELVPLGSSVFQPGTPVLADQIAKLTALISFNPSRRIDVDCALAAVTTSSRVSGVPLSPVGPLSNGVPVVPEVGMVVEKFGASTGHTIGTVSDTDADFQIDEYVTGTVFLENQIQISNGDEPFCAQGDSGAMIVDTESKQPTGLLAINMGGFAVANRLSVVLTKLGAQIGSSLKVKIS